MFILLLCKILIFLCCQPCLSSALHDLSCNSHTVTHPVLGGWKLYLYNCYLYNLMRNPQSWPILVTASLWFAKGWHLWHCLVVMFKVIYDSFSFISLILKFLAFATCCWISIQQLITGHVFKVFILINKLWAIDFNIGA